MFEPAQPHNRLVKFDYAHLYHREADNFLPKPSGRIAPLGLRSRRCPHRAKGLTFGLHFSRAWLNGEECFSNINPIE